jgi:serine/threonine protein kinase/tetratricopeptide (TPR) repeat protein
MTESQEYGRLNEIFAAVVERKTDDRAAELDRLCGNDAALRQQVELLLGFHDQEDGPLADPLVAGVTGTKMVRLSENVGDRIGPYRLLQKIGEGGFGVVYMADQKEPVRRKVALKIIKLGMDTKQVIARFEVERQALAMMDHPNIARVLDAGATETGRPYFVMELVKGDPVTEYCDRQSLSTKERLEIFQMICHAVQHAHQKGVIHRDLKPSNVLLTVADGRPIPKVIDFGIAKATNRELTDKTLFTEFRQLVGTPEYMSPEQAEMTGVDIDTRSDIYSLGVLLYELLTGTTPFASTKLRSAAYGEIQRIIREEEPPKPSTRLHELMTSGQLPDGDERSSIQYIARHRRTEPSSLGKVMRGDLDWIVMKCLEKDRTRRYETANGLAGDIRRYLGDEPVSAGPPSTSYRMRKFIRRNRAAVAMTGVVTVALVLGVIGTSWGLAEAVHERNRALEAEGRATRQLARSEEVARVITEMLSNIEPGTAQGTDITLLKSILDDTAARLEVGEIADELVAAELRSIIATTCFKLGLDREAERHLSAAVKIHTRLLGTEHISTLTSMNNLALVFEDQDRFAEAEQLHLESLEISRRLLGAEHPDTLSSMHNLAVVYNSQGRHAEAEALNLETLEIRQRVLGPEHPDTLKSMGFLVIQHHRQGRLAEAETLSLKTLEIRRRTLGDEHPDTQLSRANLADLYKSQRRYAEAESLYLKTLEIKRRVLGDEHPRTLLTMNNLADLYRRQGRYAEAASLFLETIEIKKRVLGEEHTSTLFSMHGLATMYMHHGEHAEAESLFLETIEGRRRVLGPEHPNTLDSMHNLAYLYDEQGRYAEAEPLNLETLEIRRRVLGEEHEDTLKSMSNMAIVYKARSKHAEAETLSLELLEIQRRTLGEEHRFTLGTITNLGWLYNTMGRYDNARAMFETSLPIKRRILTTRHPWTRFAMQGLATAYKELGRPADALPLQRELFELRLAAAESPDATGEALNAAAWDLLTHDVEALRDPHRALVLARQACDRAAPAPPAMLDTLALALFETGDVAAAVETARQAVERLPDDAPDRQEYVERLRQFENALDDAAQGQFSS